MKKIKRQIFNENRENILRMVNQLEDDEEVYLRRFTPEEIFRLMGVPDGFIKRLTNPHAELLKAGFSESQIDALLTVDGKRVTVRDRDLQKQAGNSIVVDVLYHVFDKLLFAAPSEKTIKATL
jgi:site-specific DNA-cytosine methylase